MREQLCRAACLASGLDPNRKYGSSSDHPANAPYEFAWQEFGQEVDAILAELREPDASVLGTGAEFYSAYNSDLVDIGTLEAAFTAMIDAIRGDRA